MTSERCSLIFGISDSGVELISSMIAQLLSRIDPSPSVLLKKLKLGRGIDSLLRQLRPPLFNN